MPQSLLDFGNMAQLAQNQLQNTISMAHLGMQQDRLNMQQSRADTYADQLKLQQDQLKQTTMMNLHKLWNDPGIAMVPGAREEIGAKIGELAGAPSVNFNSMGVSRDTYNKYVQGLSSGDPKAFHEGMDGLIATLPIDDAKKVIETIQNSGINAEKYQNMVLARKDHEAKVEEIQNKNALITYAKPLYQGASFDGDRLLAGGESPGLKKLRDTYEQAGPTAKGDLLSSKNPLVPDKKAFAHMLDGKLGQASLKYDAVAKDYGDQVNQDLDLLKQHEHGIALPEGLNPSILQSRIEANSQLASYSRAMADYTADPLDKTKYAAAKEAAKTMNANRLNIEALEKNTNAQRMQLQTTLANFRMDEAQRKNSQASALAEAQRQYYALPTNQQNMQAASKISQGVKDSTGFDVTPEDIFKNPNKPLVENVTKVNMTQEREEAKKVGGGFGDQYIDMQKADVDSRSKMAKYDRMDQLLSGMQTGKLVPATTQVQSIADSLGLSVDKSLPAKQAFQALSGEIALTLRNPSGGAGMPGALSDKDLAFLQSMTPDLGKTTEGNKLIIETARKLAKRDQDVAKMARDYRKKNGQFDEGFYEKLADYSDKNQLFQGKVAPQSKAAPQIGKPAPAPQSLPTIKGDADFNKLPSGSIFIGPDGKKRRKP